MPQRYKQLSQLAGDNTRNTAPFLTLLTEQNKIFVIMIEGHALLTLRSIIILELSPVRPFMSFQN